MTFNPLVSICMSAYNAEKYIEETINCLLNQTYYNLEIIIVDDGSTDGTKRILEQIQDPRIVISYQDHKGQSAAANIAYKQSSGDLIKFMDADDLISEEFIENQVIKLNGKKDEIASASWGRFYNDDITTFKLNPEKVWCDMQPMDWLVESLSSGSNMMQCGLWLIPRSILDRSGLWNEKLSLINDFDFFTRVILASSQIFFTEDAVLYYRSGIQNSLSAQKSKEAMDSAYLSTLSGTETILGFENSSRTRKVCANAFQQLKYQLYPQYLDLYESAKDQVIKLGGSTYPFPAGGATLKLSKLLGWKLTKRIKLLVNQKQYLFV